MTYQETVEYLYSRLPMFQRDGKSAYKKDLNNTYALLEKLDNPHEKFKSVHIAGTNGKGTCAHSIAAVLQTAGYKTGLYTSPHLKHFTERIRIDGLEVDQTFVIDFVADMKSAINEINPSFFEITVAMAFSYFAEKEVDIAVIETGLGGRLDSTNVIRPEACLITNIGYDHMDMLGDTLEKIANEKAGIIKERVPVVIGEYHEETFPVFAEKAKRLNAPLYLSPSMGLSDIQDESSYTKFLNRDKVSMLAHVLKERDWKISDKDFKEGVDNMERLTGLKGRGQVLSDKPLTLADVSHNEQGLQALFSFIKPVSEQGTLHLIFGTVIDKDLDQLFRCFPDKAQLYWTQSSVPRSLPVERLAEHAATWNLQGDLFSNVNEAVAAARINAKPEDVVLVTGSTFVVAELEEL